MKTKEKAKDLFDKYCYAIRIEETDSGYFTNVLYAKECALIAVDEIINHHSQEQGLYRIDTYYWQQVKLELYSL